MYFDSHAHFDDVQYDDDRHQLIEEMHQNGVDFIINSCDSMESAKKAMALAEKYNFIYANVGVHPSEVENMTEEDIKTLAKYAENPKVVAIGEIGLDYHYDDGPSKEKQQYWFKRQLDLTADLNMPVVVHSRDAAQDTFDIIKASRVRKGLIHAFSGSKELAQEYKIEATKKGIFHCCPLNRELVKQGLKMGFYISVGGVVTFKNAKKLVEVVENVPIDKILVETDSPYLSPTPLRGTRNNSQNLKYIVEKIAQIKQLSPQIVAQKTKENALEVFC